MISDKAAKMINILPKGLVVFVSKKLVDGYLKKYANIKVKGLNNLQNIQKPTIFVCNHLSNADGLVLNKVLKSVDPTFVAGVKLSNNPVTNIGINVVKTTTIVPNSTDKDGIKKIVSLIKQGESLLIFPEGTRSRVGSMIEAKRGIILIAKLTKAPIVPVSICGTEKLLPINQNDDMASEKFQNADVYVKIGEQFAFPEKTEEQDKKEYEESAVNFIMKKIAELLPEQYRGVYK